MDCDIYSNTKPGPDWPFICILIFIFAAAVCPVIFDPPNHPSSKPKPIPARIAPTTCLHTT